MNMKKCTIEEIPEPPPPDPCTVQRIQQKIKAGIKICPKPPVKQPTPPPSCHALCIERVKNPPLKGIGKFDFPVVCTVEREVTTTDRCDAILAATAPSVDLPYPRCPPVPPPPPDPVIDPCEEQAKAQKAARCKKKYSRYYE